MKIVHVEDYFDPSAGYQINELVYANKIYNDEVYIITSTDMTPFHKSLNLDMDREFENNTGAKLIRLDPIIKVSGRLILKKMWKTIKEINPDILFMHGIGDFKDLCLLIPKLQYTVIRDCHMSWIASKNRFRKIFFSLFNIIFANIINSSNKYDVIFALGDEEKEYLDNLGISDDKIKFLRHGYNSSTMYFDEADRQAIRRGYGLGTSDTVVAYIGKFDASKQPDLIFDIISNLSNELIEKFRINLLFLGSKNDEYMELFYNKYRNLKKQVNIIVDEPKAFRELRKYYSAADICIFPKETTLSSIHAQVCGCSVIMEKHTSNVERVVNQKNLFELNNIDEASEILTNLLKEDNSKRIFEMLPEREYNTQINYIRNFGKR